ncbi:Gfo/Idh/MocA family oxidoreductase [Microlunatus parietis]|uniref:Putative dehydrogenase n=1 Tax=Microlunatus parietis TaxID=682979 RepID=A0A7Y9ID99_9ACTN|nr:Gfo/Idh/MocA family oxidoreductase [Microlunatus parietis]NYE74466.1 putative dehydrogenase [Microlunatus parietis]
MKRIGFIGTENSHTDHFIRLLNAEERHPGYRAVALVGGASERNNALAEAGDISIIVDNPEDLIGQVDAAVICTRDGARHREQAEPLLKAGLPVLMDKPFATTTADAEAVIAAAQASETPLDSSSALRFVPEIAEFAAAAPQLKELRRLTVSGPADPDSEYSGLFFYGIHHVEAALEILGNPVIGVDQAVDVTRRGDTVTARTLIGDVEVEFVFVVPGADYRIPFHAQLIGTGAIVAKELTLGKDYNAPLLAKFVDVWESRTPIDVERLLSPVNLLATISNAL